MTWDTCATRYDSGEQILEAARERARRAVAATTRPVVIKPLLDRWESEPSTFVNSEASNGDLTCGNWVLGRAMALQLQSFPRAYRNIRVRRMVRLICAMHQVEPDQLIDTKRIPQDAVPAFQTLVVCLTRKGLSTGDIGRLLRRNPTSIAYQAAKYQHRLAMRDLARREQAACDRVFRDPSTSLSKTAAILWEVARKHRVCLSDLTGKCRVAKFVRARQEAMWRLRQETIFSLPQIGARIGGRDHSSVLWGIRAHQARIDAGEA